MLTIHLIKPTLSSGAYFRLIKGIDHQESVAGTSPLLSKEFFQCAREESRTHVVKLSHEHIVVYGIDVLEKIKNETLPFMKKLSYMVQVNSQQ